MSDNKVNLWRSSIMLFSFWSSSTQSLCSFSSQIVPVQISSNFLSRIFTKLYVNIQSIFNNQIVPVQLSSIFLSRIFTKFYVMFQQPVSYLAGNLLLNTALWYFSSPEKKKLGQKIQSLGDPPTWHSEPPVTSLSSLILIILKGSQSPHSPSYLQAKDEIVF